MQMNERADAEIVVIGGGIGGCSAAYHLAALGRKDVLLLDRASLSSGTTWHSSGNMETYREDPLIFSMVRYAVESLPQLEIESGQSIGWRNVGRVMYTDREERLESFRHLPELGRVRGIAIDLLSPAEIARRLPIIDPAGLLGGIWVPSDGRVNPTDVVMAYAKAARARGVRFREHMPVSQIIVRDGVVRGVATPEGDIACGTVVVAAGLWSGELVRSCGLALPLYALEHQYLITQPIAGLDRRMPLFLSHDDQLYGREEVGGLMVGSLDDRAIPVSSAELPQNFANALLCERWDQFEPYMTTAMRRFPMLRTAGIKMLLNGPESFTPDGQMLLGPVPGASGLYCLCGFNSNGIALSPAAGKYIAEWIVEGAPRAEVSPLDVRRFAAALAAESFMRARATEIPGFSCRMHAAGDDYETARNVRLSPLHAELTAAGARFKSVNGWERPLWFGRRAASTTWLEAVAAEIAAAATGTLVVDRSSDTKIAVRGAAADEWLASRVTFPAAAGNTEARTALFRGPLGEIEAMGRILPWEGGWLLTVGPEQETRLKAWLRTAKCPEQVYALDITATLALLEIHGPGAPSVAAHQAHTAHTAHTALMHDPAHDSYLLTAAAGAAAQAWSALLGGAPGAARAGGHFAQEALRIAHGIPRFGREATPFMRGPATLAAFSSPVGLPGFGARESIVAGDEIVGELTSRAGLPGWPATLSLALVHAGAAATPHLEFFAGGRRWPLAPRSTRWHALTD
jgi:glycine/D-amino acid oxidase-like deaminating enzyme